MPSRTIPPAAIAVNRPAASGPVVVSVPHAGRLYPPEILSAARVGRPDLERLEDSWCDLIAAGAADAGATVVHALWARAVADLNRGEGQMAPGEVAMPLRAQFSAPGRKERAGLGVVPTRLADCGPLWKRPIDGAALEWRLESFHRPYHAALTDVLAAARNEYGRAILIDLHSMPSIPAGQPGHGARIIVGDRFGETAGDWLIDLAVASAERLNEPVARNQPYAGGHIIRTHGRPAEAIHAVQIEIDRSLYLTPERLPDAARIARLARWFSNLVAAAGYARPEAEILTQAAE
ncbi:MULTISPECIES: N-formylglutamate amidohydrolase [unclassified Sphingopyxis]|uniref:N-formylglutamate amidohydrolase n=1 Tax=unclassified Sphingopyxis TaxID=2614943 RepID=UPI0009E6BD65|nr:MULTISPECIES: N-formylglutamate amidohydrolase [unclassified Sphingopyxis]